MAQNETLLLELVMSLARGQITKKDVASALNVSVRSVERYLSEYRKTGSGFLRHGNAGRVPHNKSEITKKEQVCQLIKEKYFDVNCTHASELLQAREGIEVHPKTLRRWLVELHFVKKAKVKKRVRRHRARMKQVGLMIQFDGSHHRWFGDTESVLIAGIDDANSEVVWGGFYESEDSLSCLDVLKKWIELKGVFGFLYTDMAGMFGGGKRHDFTQVKRALKHLGITVLTTPSPEAKGRIERLWGTLQDRLVPELRLAGVSDRAAATSYFNDVFLPNTYNKKFMLPADGIGSAYRPVPAHIELKEVMCLKEYRKVKKDHTISLGGELFLIKSELVHSIENQKIEVRIYPDGTQKTLFADRPIALEKVAQSKLHQDTDLDLTQLHKLESLKVRLDGHVKYKAHYYSVGTEFAQKHIYIYTKNGELLFYHQGQLVVTHREGLKTDPKVFTLDRHRGAMQAALSPESMYLRAARRMGPWVEKIIRIFIEQGQGFIDEKIIWGLLGLKTEYPPQQINIACQQAFEIGEVNYRTIRVLLRINRKTYPQSTTS